MRKNFGSKPLLYPQPVLIIAAYGEDGTPNAMNAAWGCIADYHKVAVIIAAEHKTTANILARGAFTVSMADADHVTEADYLGVVSGNDVPDKVAKAGLHAVKSEFVDAPIMEEFAMALECRLVSYDPESEMMIGEIVNVSADDRVLGEDGKIDPALLRPITFDPVHNAYIALGDAVGRAFCDGLALR